MIKQPRTRQNGAATRQLEIPHLASGQQDEAPPAEEMPGRRRSPAPPPRQGPLQRQPATADDVLTVGDVAALLKLPGRTVAEYAARGVLPSVKIGRHRRFSRRELEGLMRSAPGDRAPSQLR
jgi:excisionase family DNA binding protein